ncbi:uncharacterized protein DUF899 [Kribbella sp. VKM Ac-2568]|nr:uncharacterized protein DUF899 [Kribbella sp. VKM Ac-2568]
MTIGNLPEVVSREEWLAARRELLAKEKELTRARDRLNADRRRLPMVRMDKPYVFEGPDGNSEPARPVRGPATTGDAPLHVRPGLGPRLPELFLRRRRDRPIEATARAQHDTRRGLPSAVRETRRFPLPGISTFLRVDNEVFHTYSTYGRGIEEFHNGYHYLDLTALGRQEPWEEPQGRATPLGLQVGGPAMRLPDEYDT